MADAPTAVLDRAAGMDELPTDIDVAAASATHLVVTQWLSDAVRSRLGAVSGLDLVDDIDRVGGAALVVVSTRLPAQQASIVSELRAATTCPIVAIVHPGGEATAVDFLAAGASGLVAEGNEGAVVAFLGDEHDGSGFLESFEQTLGRRSLRSHTAAGDRDPVTRLRGESALESRLAATHGPVPRLAYARLVGLEEATRRLSMEAKELLRRRIALQCDEVCRNYAAEIYATAPGEFAVVSEDLGIAEFERLGQELMERVRGYSPDRSAPLRLAIGHAGPEATAAIDSLRELALRGADLAATLTDGAIVGAERLTMSLAASTELDTMLRAVALVEERDAYPGSHGERVSKTAVAIGEAMGLSAQSLVKLRLAARLHDVGKLDLSDDVVAGTVETLDGSALQQYHTHPYRGAALLRPNAGYEVAEAVASHHEHWDGTGFPDGLDGTDIPVGARIIAAADAMDRWSAGGAVSDVPSAAAVEKLQEGAGTLFDPAVVDACVTLFGNT